MAPSELELLQERLLLQQRIDEFLESAGSRRVSLEVGLGETLPVLCRALDADAVWVETYDDSLEMRSFAADGDGPCPPSEDLVSRGRELTAGGGRRVAGDGDLVVCRLDVAGEDFGSLGARCPGGASPREQELLHVAAEVLDNYLAAIRDSREKQRLLRDIHRALSHPVVHQGVTDAVRRITDTVRFDLLIVLYHLEDDYRNTLHYLVFRGEELEFSSKESVAEALDQALHGHGLAAPPGGSQLIKNAEVEHRRVVGQAAPDLATEARSEELLSALGYRECLETVLITGMDSAHSVGKLVVGSRRPLSTYERDVFDLFADVLQKRIVDFSKVGKILHRTFPTPVVLRLLDDPAPMAQLQPTQAEISILFADVASFTRLSEQVLRDPDKVGAFIDVWSRGATQVIWEHGGVFDKLVGDCAIGLFGPPFYEKDPAERALACARAAAGIVRFTGELLKEHVTTARIREAGEPLGVAVGLNDCTSSVGLFGLNENFTAFSPGMNNAARLQSLAVRDEVLVMEPMKELLESAGAGLRFGERREGKVKNVAEPLSFYALDVESAL